MMYGIMQSKDERESQHSLQSLKINPVLVSALSGELNSYLRTINIYVFGFSESHFILGGGIY